MPKVKPKHLTHKPWSHHWPAMVAGVFVVLGSVTMIMLAVLFLIPPPSADATLDVSVVTEINGATRTSTVGMRTNSALEAISRVSNKAGSPMVYDTRDGRATLVNVLGRTDGQGGQWTVFVGGRKVTNLATTTVRQGDVIRLQWTPSI